MSQRMARNLPTSLSPSVSGSSGGSPSFVNVSSSSRSRRGGERQSNSPLASLSGERRMTATPQSTSQALTDTPGRASASTPIPSSAGSETTSTSSSSNSLNNSESQPQPRRRVPKVAQIVSQSRSEANSLSSSPPPPSSTGANALPSLSTNAQKNSRGGGGGGGGTQQGGTPTNARQALMGQGGVKGLLSQVRENNSNNSQQLATSLSGTRVTFVDGGGAGVSGRGSALGATLAGMSHNALAVPSPSSLAKLAQLRQQPKNLSPAAGMRLPPMIPGPAKGKEGKVLLLLDLDETLVHASFTDQKPFDLKVTIEADEFGEGGDIFVAYRPHVHEFIAAIAPLFEVGIFTASQGCYANPVIDALDPRGSLGKLRMFREHCTQMTGARVKDMSLLGRPLERIALVDNSPVTYLFQPRNGIPIASWFDDPKDTELLTLIPLLRQLSECKSVYDVLDPFNAGC